MDCLTAQTKITSYVEGKLSDEELKEFLLHVEKCPGCKEELEIYYTLMEATRQLDEGVLTTSNFSKELDEKIERELEAILVNERWNNRANFIVTTIILAIVAIGAMKMLGIDFPFFPREVTWEDEKKHIEEYMLPYMLDYPFDLDNLMLNDLDLID